MAAINIWTDGACSKRLGGWAYVIKMGKHTKENSGAVEDTTNNRMEMQAAIEALKALTRPCEVVLHSDSELLCNGFNQNWVRKWINNDWVTTSGGSVANQDLWEQLVELNDTHSISWVWVEGHADCEENNRCDELAVQARLSLQQDFESSKDKLSKALTAIKHARNRAHAAQKLIEELFEDAELGTTLKENISLDAFKEAKKCLAALTRAATTVLEGKPDANDE